MYCRDCGMAEWHSKAHGESMGKVCNEEGRSQNLIP